MKEYYFTENTIGAASEEMLSELYPFLRKNKPQFNPDRSALLLLDLQDYFLTESSHAFIPSSAAILPGIQALLKTYRQHNLPTIFTRHLNTNADSQNMATWWRDLITEDNPLSAIHSSLDSIGAYVMHKSQYDAFLGTQLEEYLLGNQVKQVVICGVMTHLCCETTARSAFMRGFQVFFTIDGTATYHRQFHKSSLLNLAHGFAVPVLVRQLLEAFNRDEQ